MKKLHFIRPIYIFLIVMSALGTAIWSGCSVEKHYDLLSYFFDGVPDPNASLDGPESGLFARNPRVVYKRHVPFAERLCFDCHSNPSDMKMDRNDSNICLNCHDGVPDQYAYMHGPVVAISCLQCHDPHQSQHDYLLRVSTSELCQFCHNQEMLGVSHEQQHVKQEEQCLNCHSGHGGSQRFFLHDEMIGEDTGANIETPDDAGEL